MIESNLHNSKEKNMNNDPNAHLPSHAPENKPNCYEHFGQCEYVEGDCDTCFWDTLA